MLGVAVAALDDQIGDGIEDQGRRAAHKKARRLLKRAADALANQQPGDAPPAGGMADKRTTAPGLRAALMALVGHATGAQDAMTRMMTGPGNVPWEVSERLSLDDLQLLIITLHDLMQIVAMMIIDVTARDDEDTYEDRMTLAESRAKGVSVMEGMETIAQTIARRLRDCIEGAPRGKLKDPNVH